MRLLVSIDWLKVYYNTYKFHQYFLVHYDGSPNAGVCIMQHSSPSLSFLFSDVKGNVLERDSISMCKLLVSEFISFICAQCLSFWLFYWQSSFHSFKV